MGKKIFIENGMEVLVCIVAFLIILVGIIGVFAPMIPTPICAWFGYLICFIGWDQGPIGWKSFLLATVLTAFAHIFELVGSYFGAKWFGATWRGGVGALLGGIIGPLVCFFLIPGVGLLAGLIIGPVIGALTGEMLAGRNWGEASKAGVGTIIGNLSAMLLKLCICLFMLVLFIGLVGAHAYSSLRDAETPEWMKMINKWFEKAPAQEQPAEPTPAPADMVFFS
ncbi:MAG: DUF456 domain-containing protein [Puniceicoccales bacterium]|nr:DUF456 domain-containing protein [Puniceicoccales bacterium]